MTDLSEDLWLKANSLSRKQSNPNTNRETDNAQK